MTFCRLVSLLFKFCFTALTSGIKDGCWGVKRRLWVQWTELSSHSEISTSVSILSSYSEQFCFEDSRRRINTLLAVLLESKNSKSDSEVDKRAEAIISVFDRTLKNTKSPLLWTNQLSKLILDHFLTRKKFSIPKVTIEIQSNAGKRWISTFLKLILDHFLTREPSIPKISRMERTFNVNDGCFWVASIRRWEKRSTWWIRPSNNIINCKRLETLLHSGKKQFF